jgi:hypothetical protein
VREVLRIWLLDERFATFHCARCGIKGVAYADRGAGRRIDREAMQRARAEADTRDRETAALQLGKARWFWHRRLSIQGTVVEIYLRDVRGYGGAFPATLAFLPPCGMHGPAMIAAYGVPLEPQPGTLVMPEAAVVGVQLTRLTSKGRKLPENTKVTIGRCLASPIVLAPMNDLLGLAIAEGAEDGLSIAEATGLGSWASGGASRMPALATTVPDYTGCISVIADADEAGRRNSTELVARLRARRLWAEILTLDDTARWAA